MLSTTVETGCRQRAFRSLGCRAADTVGPRAMIEAAAIGAPTALTHTTIHPAVDGLEAYGATARANSPAAH